MVGKYIVGYRTCTSIGMLAYSSISQNIYEMLFKVRRFDLLCMLMYKFCKASSIEDIQIDVYESGFERKLDLARCRESYLERRV